MKDEIKREKFIRLAEARTNSIIKVIRLLSNLSNNSAYLYTEKDIKEIFNSIDKELKQARSKFEDKGKGKNSDIFKLSSN